MYDKLNKVNGTKFTFNMTEDELDALHENLTIRDIFDYTPSAEDAIESCRVKIPQSYKLIDKNNFNECQAMFNVSRFFMVEYMCYRYEYMLEPNLFLFDQLANTPKLSGVFYEITPGKFFKNYEILKFVAHSHGVYPAKSIGIAPLLSRGNNWEKDDVNAAVYMTSYFKLIKYRLPPPRTTACLDYKVARGMRSQEICKQGCQRNKTIENLNRIPFSSLQKDPIDMKAISYLDSLNENVRKSTFKYYNECSAICHSQDCRDIITFNRVSKSMSSELKIQLMIPLEPWVTVNFRAMMTMAEYLTYFLSCFGTWFGLSVFNLDPIGIGSRLLNIWKSREQTKSAGAPGRADDKISNSSIRKMLELLNRKQDILFIRQNRIEQKCDKITHQNNNLGMQYLDYPLNPIMLNCSYNRAKWKE